MGASSSARSDRRSRSLPRLLVVLVPVAALGCTGTIGDGRGGGNNPPRGGGEPAGGGAGGGMNPAPRPGEPDNGATGPGDPGRVSLRRLNRDEYNNTVRDLLGTALRPADAFDADPAGFGYDNNGDVQTLTTQQIDQYQGAAQTLVAEATAAGLQRIADAGRTPACDLAAAGCARKLVAGFARRAWRRPVTDAEVARLMAVASAAGTRGQDALGQLRFALVAVLSAPHFYFKVETDADPASATPHALGSFELASRLSYLIYRSMPDDALFAAAEGDRLATADEVRAQAVRMLADPRGSELVGGFVGQWLDFNSLAQHEVDPAKVGITFSRELAMSMQAETRAFFAEFLTQNLPVTELLTAPFTFVDARLAQHYGLPAPAGGGMKRVELTDGKRRGLLTHASVLTATSNPDRTSPVARGSWVLTHLLCAPPPPPPPDVPPLPESEDVPTTTRAQIEAHRVNPGCASCHAIMDPIGLGLENYDAVGRWRDTEAGMKIDPSGVLPDGASFSGAQELTALLTKDPGLPACVGANLFTYAVSRRPEAGTADGQHVERIVRAAAGGGSVVRLRDLLLAVVTSDPFRLRRGEPASTGPGARP